MKIKGTGRVLSRRVASSSKTTSNPTCNRTPTMQTPISAMSRPPSSMSQRAASRISQRPGSRLSHRPPTRSSNRLMQTIQILVTQVTGLTETSGEQYRHSVELVSKAADSVTKQAVGQDLQTNINRLKQ